MPQIIRYWRPNGALHDTAPGIRILAGDTNFDGILEYPEGSGQMGYPYSFAAYAQANLNYLYATPAGRRILNHMVYSNSVCIALGTRGCSVQATDPIAAMNRVAHELVLNTRVPGPATRSAFRLRYGHPNGARVQAACADFATRLNGQSLWDLDRRPGFAGGWRSLIQRGFDRAVSAAGEVTTMARPDITAGHPSLFAPQTSGLDITGPEVQEWIMNGRRPPRLALFPRMLRQLRCATIVGLSPLERMGTRGGGCQSTVRFAIDPHQEVNLERPPAIGLGHELIHAFFSMLGQQPGHQDTESPAGVLYEFKCIGIGPWEGAEISENALRRQWHHALNRHGATMDAANRRTVTERVRY